MNANTCIERWQASGAAERAQHPKLTLTDIYNVLEKLRAGEPLSAKEKLIHEQGLLAILHQLHDELDQAVFAAYDWPPGLSDEEILSRLVFLNAERAAAEAQGQVRWLRPAYQASDEVAQPHQAALLETAEPDVPLATSDSQPWSATMAERARAVRAILAGLGSPATPRQVADILDTLAVLGQAEEGEGGVYTAV